MTNAAPPNFVLLDVMQNNCEKALKLTEMLNKATSQLCEMDVDPELVQIWTKRADEINRDLTRLLLTV